MEKIKSKYDVIASYKRKDKDITTKLEIAKKGNRYYYRMIETDQHIMSIYSLFGVPLISKFKPISKAEIDNQLNRLWVRV